MQVSKSSRCFTAVGTLTWFAAIAVSFVGCSAKPAPITAANATKAYGLGAALEAEDRAKTKRHNAAMAKLVRVGVLSAHETGRAVDMTVSIHNLIPRTIRLIRMGLEIRSLSGTRLALAELHSTSQIRGNAAIVTYIPVSYARFGEDAALMTEAKTVEKRYLLSVEAVEYAGGGNEGYDD